MNNRAHEATRSLTKIGTNSSQPMPVTSRTQNARANGQTHVELIQQLHGPCMHKMRLRVEADGVVEHQPNVGREFFRGKVGHGQKPRLDRALQRCKSTDQSKTELVRELIYDKNERVQTINPPYPTYVVYLRNNENLASEVDKLYPIEGLKKMK